MIDAYVGLGSNLGDPLAQLRRAVRALAALPGTRLCAVSPRYRNRPLGPADQPDYVNAVARLATDLAPRDLLAALQDIERAQGRVRDGRRWGPRTLDLDLLLYGDEVIDEPGLRVPHPGLAERDFVVLPLARVAPPGLTVPGRGRLTALAARFDPAALIEVDHDDPATTLHCH